MHGNFYRKRSTELINSDVIPCKQQRIQSCFNLKSDCTDKQESRYSAYNTQLPESQKTINTKKFQKLVSEKDVGITEYLNNLPGFSAVIKERYSDFLVNEVDLSGNTVRLTHFNEPVEVKTAAHWDSISEDDLKLIEELKQDLRKQVFINVTSTEKDGRRKIHDLIRKEFSGLDSKTESYADEKYIVIEKLIPQTSKQQRGGNFNKKNWKDNKPKKTSFHIERRFHPHERADYTHFVLYKENKDTMDAVKQIAALIGMPSKYFSYAGTKDKRGKTVQVIAAYRLPATKLLTLNKRMPLMKVGNVEYKTTPLKLGDLSGNHFIVILRQLLGDFSRIDECISSLASQGFVNYYGLQRFGTRSVPTYQIGRALVKEHWKEAIDLILQPKGGYETDGYESTDAITRACRIYFRTGDAAKACDHLYYRAKSTIEGHLLMGLQSSDKTDYVNALNHIPRNTRLMYLHSYQSYIWNKVASRKVREFGLQPQIGDLITSEPVDFSEILDDLKAKQLRTDWGAPREKDKVENSLEKKQNITDDTQKTKDACDSIIEENVELNKSEKIETEMYDHSEDSKLDSLIETAGNDNEELNSSIKQDEESGELLRLKIEPDILGESKLSSKTIFDVVLPLPGHSVKYPDNETKLWYEEYLKEDGLDFDSFSSRVKMYSLSGAYRKLIVKPADAKYEILCYKDVTIPLVLSDYDIMQKHQLPPPIPPTGEDVKKALKLEFTLPSSSYATMAIREILKSDTNQNYF